MGVSYFKKKNNIDGTFRPPRRSNLINLYKQLVPTQGREPRQDGGVAKENNSPIPRSTEDAPSEHTQLPVELLATQDHKSEGVE
jgi:hypothetical protein